MESCCYCYRPFEFINMTGGFMKALILCGGKGTRLRFITDKIPKPLVHLRNKPLLEYLMGYLIKKGFNDFVLLIGYKGSMIKEHFSKKEYGVNIEFVDSGDADIIQRVYDARDTVKDRFILLYGDTIANVDINKLIKFHKSHGKMITLTTYPMRSPFGLIFSDKSKCVEDFKEKPILDYWMNIGFIIMEKDAIKHISKNDTFILFLKKMISKKEVYEFKHTEAHITVNDEKEKKDAEKSILEFYTYL